MLLRRRQATATARFERAKDGGIVPLLDELLGSASKVANHA